MKAKTASAPKGANRTSEELHTYRNDVILRLSRIIGHLESVRSMVDANRECVDVITQLSAVRSALNSVVRIILSEHITDHVVRAAERKDLQDLAELGKLVDRILR